MAHGSEREGSPELITSVDPISGPNLKRRINAQEDNIAGRGFQSPTFNIHDPRSTRLTARLRRNQMQREAAARSNPLVGRSRPIQDPPESVRSPSRPKTIEPSPAASVLQRPAPVDSAAGSQLGDEDEAPVNDDASEEDDGDFENMQFSPRRVTSSIAAKRSQHAAESNKENEPQLAPEPRRNQKRRMNEPQEGARALSFDSQERVDNSQVEVPDPTQDQGFQMSRNNARVQSGGVGNRRNRRATADIHDRGPSPTKRPRTHDPQREDEGRAVSDTAPLRERPPPTQADVYATINSTAKARNAGLPRSTQVRKPWSTEETDRLLDLIQEFGPKWARLKSEDTGGVLGQRDQVALKDKARNMKLDYLKAGRVLPKNFEAIAISNLQIERLHQMRIEYDKETGHRVDGIFNDEEDDDE